MRRIRILIYESADEVAMAKQLSHSIQGTKVVAGSHYGGGRPLMTIQAIDWDWRRMTLMELWQLVKLEWQATRAEVGR